MAEHPVSDASTGEPALWRDWWSVGCGVESLHHLLTERGADVSLDELLNETLAADGYLPDLGWKHHALVEMAARHGAPGLVCGPLTIADVMPFEQCAITATEPAEHDDWIISVTAPEQFTSTHLVHVRRRGLGLAVFWPQGQLDFGESFVIEPQWIAARMTGRGMRFPAT